MGVFKNRLPQNGWFIMENWKTLLKMDDLGVPLFLETQNIFDAIHPLKKKNQPQTTLFFRFI